MGRLSVEVTWGFAEDLIGIRFRPQAGIAVSAVMGAVPKSLSTLTVGVQAPRQGLTYHNTRVSSCSVQFK